jgi:hypothetical protein
MKPLQVNPVFICDLSSEARVANMTSRVKASCHMRPLQRSLCVICALSSETCGVIFDLFFSKACVSCSCGLFSEAVRHTWPLQRNLCDIYVLSSEAVHIWWTLTWMISSTSGFVGESPRLLDSKVCFTLSKKPRQIPSYMMRAAYHKTGKLNVIALWCYGLRHQLYRTEYWKFLTGLWYSVLKVHKILAAFYSMLTVFWAI